MSQALGAMIPADDAALEIQQGDGVVRIAQHGAEMACLRLGREPMRDVDPGDHHATDPVVGGAVRQHTPEIRPAVLGPRDRLEG